MKVVSIFAILLSLGFLPDDIERLSKDFHSEPVHALLTKTRSTRPSEVEVIGYWDDGFFLIPNEMFDLVKDGNDHGEIGPGTFGLSVADLKLKGFEPANAIRVDFSVEKEHMWHVPLRDMLRLIEHKVTLGDQELELVQEGTNPHALRVPGTERADAGVSFHLAPRKLEEIPAPRTAGAEGDKKEEAKKPMRTVPEISYVFDIGSPKVIDSILKTHRQAMDPALVAERLPKVDEVVAPLEPKSSEKADVKTETKAEAPIKKDVAAEAKARWANVWHAARRAYSRHYYTYPFKVAKSFRGPSETAPLEPLAQYLLVSVHRGLNEGVVVVPSAGDPSNQGDQPSKQDLLPARIIKLDLGTRPENGTPPELKGFDIDAETFLDQIVTPGVLPKGETGRVVCQFIKRGENISAPKHSSCQYEGHRWVIHVGSLNQTGSNSFRVVEANGGPRTWEIMIQYDPMQVPPSGGKYYPVGISKSYGAK
jgi:hypothetical protein